MSKYQEIMDHVRLDDDMKKRILQNVEKKLEEEPHIVVKKAKVIPFQRYAAIAATLAVLLVGSYAVIQITGGIGNSANSTSVYAPTMEEAASMTIAPAASEEAAEATDDSAYMEGPELAEEPKINDATSFDNSELQSYGHSAVTSQPESIIASGEMTVASEVKRNPILVVIPVVLIAAIVGIILFVRKRKR